MISKTYFMKKNVPTYCHTLQVGMQNNTGPMEKNLALFIEITNAHIPLDPAISFLEMYKTMHM